MTGGSSSRASVWCRRSASGPTPTGKALLAGTSGVERVTRFDVTSYAAQIAAEVGASTRCDFIEKKDVKKMDVFIQYADRGVAVRDGRLDSWRSPTRTPRTSASSSARGSAASRPSSASTALLEGGPRKISPFFIPSAIINLASGQVSIRFGAKGPNLATCTACSASAHAIGESFEIIKRGDARR